MPVVDLPLRVMTYGAWISMDAANTGSQALRAVVDSLSYHSQELKEYIPFIDLSATLTKDEKTLYLHAVNRHENETAELKVSFRGFKPKKASQQYIAGKDTEDRNTLDNPNNVRIEQAQPEIGTDEVTLTLAPHSVNVAKTVG